MLYTAFLQTLIIFQFNFYVNSTNVASNIKLTTTTTLHYCNIISILVS
jgi:hypothetical protein